MLTLRLVTATEMGSRRPAEHLQLLDGRGRARFDFPGSKSLGGSRIRVNGRFPATFRGRNGLSTSLGDQAVAGGRLIDAVVRTAISRRGSQFDRHRVAWTTACL